MVNDDGYYMVNIWLIMIIWFLLKRWIIIKHWLVVDLPLWKMMDFVSWDDDIPNIWEVIKVYKSHVPVTTNQLTSINTDHVPTSYTLSNQWHAMSGDLDMGWLSMVPWHHGIAFQEVPQVGLINGICIGVASQDVPVDFLLGSDARCRCRSGGITRG